MIIQQTSPIPNFLGQPNTTYRDDKIGRNYRRIYAGMTWPSMNDGAVVVLGEELNINDDLGERPIWVLAEYGSRIPSEIFSKCREFKKLMCVESFYGDVNNHAMMELKWESKPGFDLQKAPSIDDPNAYETHLVIIREKASPVRKVLNFEAGAALKKEREGLDKLSSVPAGHSFSKDFPYITALGYALTALVVDAPVIPIEGPNYEPLDPGVGL